MPSCTQSGWSSCMSLCPRRYASPCSLIQTILLQPAFTEIWKAPRAPIGLQIQFHQATGIGENDAAFATLARGRPDATYVAGDSLFVTRRVHLARSSIRPGFPATFSTREYSEAGGLMSYGSNLVDAYRQVGGYAGRILKGEKPAACAASFPFRC